MTTLHSSPFERDTTPPGSWDSAALALYLEESLVCIKRSQTMPTHAGQLAFFGGKRRPSDRTPAELALREFQEESGLDPSVVELLYAGPNVQTARDHWIAPWWGRIRLSTSEFLKCVRSNGEWDHLWVLDLKELKQERNWDYFWRISPSGEKKSVLIYSIQSGYGYSSPLQNGHKPILWGATARIVWNELHAKMTD